TAREENGDAAHRDARVDGARRDCFTALRSAEAAGAGPRARAGTARVPEGTPRPDLRGGECGARWVARGRVARERDLGESLSDEARRWGRLASPPRSLPIIKAPRISAAGCDELRRLGVRLAIRAAAAPAELVLIHPLVGHMDQGAAVGSVL